MATNYTRAFFLFFVMIGMVVHAEALLTKNSKPSDKAALENDKAPINPMVSKTIPGIIEAEDFDAQSGIRTESTSDVGGGANIGFINNGDFVEYNVNVTKSGLYNVFFRVASATAGGRIVLEDLSTGEELIEVTVGNTGGWQQWIDLNPAFIISEGAKTLRMSFVGGGGFLLNVNRITFEPFFDPEPSKVIPGIIEAEDFDAQSGIRTEATSDTGGGENIGFINNGDFVEYNVSVLQSGLYNARFRVASATAGGRIVLEDLSTGEELIEVTVGNTGGWQQWIDLNPAFIISEGEKTLRMSFVGGGGFLLNVNRITFEEFSFGQSINATSQLPESMNEEASAELVLYPNPVVNYLNLNGTHLQEEEITVFDTLGRVVLRTSYKTELDVSSLNPGIYSLTVGSLDPIPFVKE